jgi:hypothetical protein
MRLDPHLSLRASTDEDPEYGFHEQDTADRALMSLENLQLLLAELRACGGGPLAIERVCDYVIRDPVYAASTRAVFRCALENLRRPAR